MRGSGTVALLHGARCFVEAVAFTALAAVAAAATSASEPLLVVPTTLVLFGAGLLLITLLREIGTERRSATVLVVTLAAGVAWGVLLPMRDPDGLGVLSRMVAFGILAEAYLWRMVSVARGGTRWTDARNAVPFAALVVTLAALVPGEIDRGPFAPLALLALAASALALSLARTTEELELTRGIVGTARASSATSATVVIAVVAIVVAAFVPWVQDLLGGLGDLLGPPAARVLYLLLLPLAYVVGYLIEILRPLISGQWQFRLREPFATTPEQEAELLRQMEETRPYIFGAAEIIVAAIALLFAIALFDRMLRDRRVDLPDGVTLEREAAEGIGLRDTLRSLLPRRTARRRGPRDDGTPAAAIRVAYWRFLTLAQSRGAGWRAEPETPREHEWRIASADPRWRAADVIVRAFEDLRYGDLVPDADTVAGARAALRALEAPTR